MLMKSKSEKCQELLKLLGLRLKELRDDKKLTQKMVYELTKIHIGRLELGYINVSLATLFILCGFYNIKLWQLFKVLDL